MPPLRRLLKTWRSKEPEQFRTPMSVQVLLALFATACAYEAWSFATVLLVCFHCLLRPDEVLNMTWGDVASVSADFLAWYPAVWGLVGVRKPKMRKAPQSRHQFVVIEDPYVAGWLDWMTAGLTADELKMKVFPRGYPVFYNLFQKFMKILGVQSLELSPGSLRAGGATHHYLMFQDVPRLRRRGRWRQEATLEHYVQEAVYALQLRQLDSSTMDRLQKLVSVAQQLLNDNTLATPAVADR